MKAADIEPGPKRGRGLRPQAGDLAVANHVGQRLPAHDDVAIDFGLNRVLADGGVAPHVLHCLLARPLLRVDARVHHEAPGAEQLH